MSPWRWAIWLLFQDLSLGWRSVCLLICCVYLRGCFGCCGKIRALCILFSPIARKKEPHWQRFREMHAFCAEAGRIFVPCIRFGVQSGDFGYIARESCQGGPFFCVEVPGIMHGAKILPTLGVARASPLRRAADRGRFPTWSRKTAGLSDLTWP